MDNVRLIDWTILGNYVSLIYSDCSSLFVRKSDFNRAFGTIISASYNDVLLDFAVEP